MGADVFGNLGLWRGRVMRCGPVQPEHSLRQGQEIVLKPPIVASPFQRAVSWSNGQKSMVAFRSCNGSFQNS